MDVNLFKNYIMNWIPSLEKSEKPLYLVIAEQLENDIKNGILLPGTKLPSQRDLANFLNINLGTIAKSFKICRQKGLIYGSVGKGTFVSSDTKTKEIMFSSSKLSKQIEMGSLFSDNKLSKKTISKINLLLNNTDSSLIFQYDGPAGNLFQRKAMIKLSYQLKLQTNEKNILFTSGSQNAITAIFMSFFKKGDRVGTTSLIYPGVKAVANMLGIQLVPIKEKNNEITKEGIEYACKNENIKGLYLIPDYNVPTTHIMSDKLRKEIANIAINRNLLIIEDSPFSLLNQELNPPIARYAPENTFYIFSTSKVLAHGLRFAFVITPIKYKYTLLNTLYNINISTSPLIIDIVSRMINEGLINTILEEKRKLIIDRNIFINDSLKDYKLFGNVNCPFRWLILPTNITGKEFEDRAHDLGLNVYCSERYSIGGIKPINAIRLSILPIRNNDDFKKAVSILKKILLTLK